MSKTDYISGTEDAYNTELIKVQVSGVCCSEKSIGCLVDLKFNQNGENISASRQEWFPKSICSIDLVEYERDHFGKKVTWTKYFLTAPKWILDKNKVAYKKET